MLALASAASSAIRPVDAVSARGSGGRSAEPGCRLRGAGSETAAAGGRKAADALTSLRSGADNAPVASDAGAASERLAASARATVGVPSLSPAAPVVVDVVVEAGRADSQSARGLPVTTHAAPRLSTMAAATATEPQRRLGSARSPGFPPALSVDGTGATSETAASSC